MSDEAYEQTQVVSPSKLPTTPEEASGIARELQDRQSMPVVPDRRAHPRVRVGCPATVTPLDDQHDEVAEPYVVVVRDVSDGGIAFFFLSSRPFPYELMRVDIPVDDVVLRAVARVQHRKKTQQFHEVTGRFLARLENVPADEASGAQKDR